MTHRYDLQNITSVQFLYEVMYDRTLPLTKRVDAAAKLMQIEPDGPPKPTIKIEIPYMGDLWFSSFSPELQKDLMYLKWCYDNGIIPPDLENVSVAGHG